eukprot:scaffold216312_cov31-Tisochrysis_lutea.AAC.1
MPRKRSRAAATVGELGGVVSSKVSFIRTDARAACESSAPSQTSLKAALSSPFEPSWPHVPAALVSQLLSAISAECTVAISGQRPGPGVIVGLRAATRALRRGELSALIAVAELQPPMLLAGLAVLADAKDTHLSVIPSTSTVLGQPFGFLRAAVIGFSSSHFAPSHQLVKLVVSVPRPKPCWLPRKRAIPKPKGLSSDDQSSEWQNRADLGLKSIRNPVAA